MAGSLPIAGRVAEQAVLAAVYERVLSGRPKVVLITGEAGIGKTRLVEELIAAVTAAAPDTDVRVGESVPLAGATLAYGPFLAALGDQAGWLLADDRAGDMRVARHSMFVGSWSCWHRWLPATATAR